MTLSEMAEEAKEETKRRIANPLFSAYFLSWAVLNYQLLMVLLSDGDYEKKIRYINSNLHAAVNWYWMFGLPAVTALAYVLLSPVLSSAVELWDNFVQVGKNRFASWVEVKRWRSDEELMESARNAGYERDSVRDRAKASIIVSGDLTYALMAMRGAELDIDRAQLIGLRQHAAQGSVGEVLDVLENTGLPHGAYAMLKILADRGYQKEDQIIRDSGTQNSQGTSTIAFLLGAKLIELVWKDGALPGYRATKEGRKLSQILVEHYSHLFN